MLKEYKVKLPIGPDFILYLSWVILQTFLNVWIYIFTPLPN